jgi:predicted ATPase
MDLAERRMTENEMTFRRVNEALRRPRPLADAEERRTFACECSRETCSTMLELTVGEYEAVRASGRRFFVHPDHAAHVDRPVSRLGTCLVVEKVGEAARLAEAADPRG